jgi:hypothetical protein
MFFERELQNRGSVNSLVSHHGGWRLWNAGVAHAFGEHEPSRAVKASLAEHDRRVEGQE